MLLQATFAGITHRSIHLTPVARSALADARFPASASGDALLCSQLMQLRILPDDIIVSGTDGLFDNVFAEEVASLVTFARKRGDSPALAATVLASYTQMKAAETTHMSPFSYAAQVPDHFELVLLIVMSLPNKLVPVSVAYFASMPLARTIWSKRTACPCAGIRHPVQGRQAGRHYGAH